MGYAKSVKYGYVRHRHKRVIVYIFIMRPCYVCLDFNINEKNIYITNIFPTCQICCLKIGYKKKNPWIKPSSKFFCVLIISRISEEKEKEKIGKKIVEKKDTSNILIKD